MRIFGFQGKATEMQNTLVRMSANSILNLHLENESECVIADRIADYVVRSAEYGFDGMLLFSMPHTLYRNMREDTLKNSSSSYARLMEYSKSNKHPVYIYPITGLYSDEKVQHIFGNPPLSPDKWGKIYVVVSFSGGVGKTSSSILLQSSLLRNGRQAIIITLDPTTQFLSDVKEDAVIKYELADSKRQQGETRYVVCSTGSPSIEENTWNKNGFVLALAYASHGYDVIVDTQAGFAESQILQEWVKVSRFISEINAPKMEFFLAISNDVAKLDSDLTKNISYIPSSLFPKEIWVILTCIGTPGIKETIVGVTKAEEIMRNMASQYEGLKYIIVPNSPGHNNKSITERMIATRAGFEYKVSHPDLANELHIEPDNTTKSLLRIW